MMSTLFITLRALLYMTGFIILWGWIALGCRRYDQSLGVILPPWTEFLGAVLMIAGGVLVLACAGVFAVHGRGTPALFDPPREFVALGPFKYTRNPMYIGGLTLLIGFSLYHRSVSMVLFSLLLFLLFHLFVVLIEEPGLGKRFGKSYHAYKETTNRWIPRWK